MAILLRVDDTGTVRFTDGEKEVMTMTEAPDEKSGRFLITLAGHLTNEVSSRFRNELAALISVGEKPTLDLSGLASISDSGMQVLLHFQKQIEKKNKNENLILTGVPEGIMEAMKSTGVAYLLEIQENRGENK